MNYELHPLCTLFPRVENEDFDLLVADISENGLREPITLADGMVLDGGNRYRACLAAGIEPMFTEFSGESLVSFVLSKNLHRRHLSAGQQAAIIASMSDWEGSHVHGGNRRSSVINNTCSNIKQLSTVENRAKESGASTFTQRKADAVVKADPALGRKVASGEVSLNAATKQVAPQLLPKKQATDLSSAEKQQADADIVAQEVEFEAWLENPDHADLMNRLKQKEAMNLVLKRENDGLQFSNSDYAKRLKSALSKIDKQAKHIHELEKELAIAQGVRAE
jgi:hypothetical protein